MQNEAVAENEPPPEDGRKIAWLIGAAALTVWFLVLWQMFGDVL